MTAIRKHAITSMKSDVITKDVVSTTLYTFEIKDWLSCSVELLRTVLMYEMPTRRYDGIRIATNDGKVLTDFITTRIQQIQLPKTTPLGPITFSTSHKSSNGQPKNIPTSFSHVVNHGNLFILGPDKHLKITANVVENSYNASQKPHHVYGYNFSRAKTAQYNENDKPFDECEFMMLEYNSGSIEFLATDEYTPQELMDFFRGIVRQFAKTVRDNWSTGFQFLLGQGELVLPGRLSTKFSELLFELMAVKYPKIQYTEDVKHGQTIMKFAGATRSEIVGAIQSTLSDIEALF